MSEVKVGDRVRVKPELANSLIQPERRLVETQRLATVVRAPFEERPHPEWLIEFDVKRKGARPVRTRFRESELEVMP